MIIVLIISTAIVALASIGAYTLLAGVGISAGIVIGYMLADS